MKARRDDSQQVSRSPTTDAIIATRKQNVRSDPTDYFRAPENPTSKPITNTSTSYYYLRFDGVYQSASGDYSFYLRFYEDFQVISTSSTGTPLQIGFWFDTSHENISRGIYKVERGNHISFSTTSESGTVDSTGGIENDILLLDSFSHINGHASERRVYRFVQIAFS